jgi:hypothetical protein
MFGTLQQMQHYAKTAYGATNTSYGTICIPLQGVLQGNGAGPSIWMLISAPLINMLMTQGFRFKSTNLLSGESYHFACYTYVDDNDLIQADKADTTPANMVADMQQMLDHRAGGLTGDRRRVSSVEKLLVRYRVQMEPSQINLGI